MSFDCANLFSALTPITLVAEFEDFQFQSSRLLRRRLCGQRGVDFSVPLQVLPQNLQRNPSRSRQIASHCPIVKLHITFADKTLSLFTQLSNGVDEEMVESSIITKGAPMAIALGWFVFAILAGYLASTKGRSGFGWFFLALFISPLIAFIAILIAGESGKKCPACAETVKLEALKCKHCGHGFTQQSVEEEKLKKASGGLEGV